MNAILKLLQFLPIVIANAEDPTLKTPTVVTKIVGWAAGLGGGLVAVFLIVSLVKDGIEFAKGTGSVSIFKIIGKALFLILIIGMIFLALNYSTLGNTAKNLSNKMVNSASNELNNVLP